MIKPVAPSTRYQGSKLKLCNWIWSEISRLKFRSVLDAFGGTGSVSYHLKSKGKNVTYNDHLKFNYFVGTALIANSKTKLAADDVDQLVRRDPRLDYEDLIASTFHGIYFKKSENVWLDTVCQNIERLPNKHKRALAYFALFQSCIIKRPYNLFHRKNLYMRTAKVHRTFYNKKIWDAPFEYHFKRFVEEGNRAVFDSGTQCRAKCSDALKVPGDYDLVYIDSPYLRANGRGVNYLAYYHFLEGLTCYRDWQNRIDYTKKHRPLKTSISPWCDRNRVRSAFLSLFERFNDSALAISYRGDGYLTLDEFITMLRPFKKRIRIAEYGKYKYVLSRNGESKEYLIIAS